MWKSEMQVDSLPYRQATDIQKIAELDDIVASAQVPHAAIVVSCTDDLRPETGIHHHVMFIAKDNLRYRLLTLGRNEPEV